MSGVEDNSFIIGDENHLTIKHQSVAQEDSHQLTDQPKTIDNQPLPLLTGHQE